MLQALREEVVRANLLLPKSGLVLFTWGNVSGIDREAGLVVIKPSGVPYEELTADNMVICDLCGKVIEGDLRPSSDLATHLVLYKAFPNIGGVTHTHSMYATSFAQAGKAIVPYGTTHADYFDGEIPCTRKMKKAEIASEYEKNTGLVIAQTFAKADPDRMHAVLVHSHGPFTWGKDPVASVEASVVLENVAQLAMNTELLQHTAECTAQRPMQKELLRKHFDRKHGPGAYYGQK